MVGRIVWSMRPCSLSLPGLYVIMVRVLKWKRKNRSLQWSLFFLLRSGVEVHVCVCTLAMDAQQGNFLLVCI